MLVVAAAGLSTLFVVAATLTPDTRGHGTHQQLGLPPCTFLVLFRRPCPSCGMTTAWAWLVRGRLLEALQANVGGTLLAILVVCCIPWLLATAVKGRWVAWTPNTTGTACVGLGLVLVTLVQWGWRLASW